MTENHLNRASQTFVTQTPLKMALENVFIEKISRAFLKKSDCLAGIEPALSQGAFPSAQDHAWVMAEATALSEPGSIPGWVAKITRVDLAHESDICGIFEQSSSMVIQIDPITVHNVLPRRTLRECVHGYTDGDGSIW
ncbi:hypothetical protein HPP92_006975 [Vanilla planifolia]|uniref:Uncharacterized protein n=1 Tax=Vanilla planifolia TaxID=51239 RepID=A0A835RQF8_VANPL|nr:hypothetical protein HPP92_006975 [Vanilla planifolia]